MVSSTPWTEASISSPATTRTPTSSPSTSSPHERETIAQRTKDALAAAKRRGVKLGGPKLDVAQEVSRHRRKSLADQRAANVVPIIRDAHAGLKSLRTVADALNARGVPTARGGAWHASSVRDALKRVEART
jgi:DNA invertase Pin-like site-specific DNA recombinase